MTATYNDRLPTAPAGGPRGWVQRHLVAASATTPPLQPSAPEAASGDERIRSKEGEGQLWQPSRSS